MDVFKDSPLLYLFNLGKLYLVFEKIYSLKKENNLLKKNAIKKGDQNIEIYQSNSVKLETITMELLKRGKDLYYKLSNKDRMYLKPYLNTFKTTSVERPLCFSTINGFPYCTCHLKHKTYLHDLYDLYHQLKLANESLRSVKSINKNLKKELSSLSIEFGALRTEVFDYNCTVEEYKEDKDTCMEKKECRKKIKTYITEANESISECLELALSDKCEGKCLVKEISEKNKNEMVTIQIEEGTNETNGDDKNIESTSKTVIHDSNIEVTNSKTSIKRSSNTSKQKSQDKSSNDQDENVRKTEENVNKDNNIKEDVLDEEEGENDAIDDEFKDAEEMRKIPDEIQLEVVHERKFVKESNNIENINDTEQFDDPDILITYKTYVCTNTK